MRPIVQIIVILAGFLLFSPPSYADGNSLLKKCTAAEKFIETNKFDQPYSVGVCQGYVRAVIDTIQIMGNEGRIKVCLPEDGLKSKESIHIVLAYLRKNFASLHQHEVELIAEAFMGAYPCSST